MVLDPPEHVCLSELAGMLSHEHHPTPGEMINWGSHNGGKLHPEFAVQSHSSDRFNQDSKVSVPPSYFLHYS